MGGLVARPVAYAKSDSIGFLRIVVGASDELRPRFADPIDAASHEFLNGFTVVDADSYGIYAERTPTVEIHLHKTTPMDDLTNYGIVSRETTLSKILNVTVDADKIAIVGKDRKVIVHYQKNTDLIRAELIRYRNQHFADLVWADERLRVTCGLSKLRRNWSESERKQLLEQGTVSGYRAMFVPGYRRPHSANLHLWTFDRV